MLGAEDKVKYSSVGSLFCLQIIFKHWPLLSKFFGPISKIHNLFPGLLTICLSFHPSLHVVATVILLTIKSCQITFLLKNPYWVSHNTQRTRPSNVANHFTLSFYVLPHSPWFTLCLSLTDLLHVSGL